MSANWNDGGTSRAQTSSLVLSRSKRVTVASQTWRQAVPQELCHDAVPAAPPPRSQELVFTPSNGGAPSTSCGVDGSTPGTAKRMMPAPYLSPAAPCRAAVGPYEAEEVALGNAGGFREHDRQHRSRLVTGKDVVALLKLEHLRLDSTPGRGKMGADSMWPCRSAPLAVTAEGSMERCGQSSL